MFGFKANCKNNKKLIPNKSAFSQSSFLDPLIYSKISARFPLMKYPIREINPKVKSWLKSLCYEDVQPILKMRTHTSSSWLLTRLGYGVVLVEEPVKPVLENILKFTV